MRFARNHSIISQPPWKLSYAGPEYLGVYSPKKKNFRFNCFLFFAEVLIKNLDLIYNSIWFVKDLE